MVTTKQRIKKACGVQQLHPQGAKTEELPGGYLSFGGNVLDLETNGKLHRRGGEEMIFLTRQTKWQPRGFGTINSKNKKRKQIVR